MRLKSLEMTKVNTFDILCGLVYRNDYDELKSLVDKGSDINVTDNDGRSLLMHAILATPPSVKMISLLIDLGSNLQHVDKQRKWSALHFAAQSQYWDISKMLIEHGAIVDLQESNGNTPLWIAVMNKKPNLDLVKGLVCYGAYHNKINNYGVSPMILVQRMYKNQENGQVLLDFFMSLDVSHL
jgi:uncharacterized protein